ncbi:hypothetical protein SAMN05444169_1940 [Bradyrhizobium erythrophlei]|jgi:hypothetical protein|uniref:Uncharacterized protein n=1 Tax=Bradyrhizobium erythrophlei TaxID=1437360 RepID=A0A1M5J226_9BRAD|nr:hypothetical protein SAMN05444169_1940 [Bradyrhizobium erythrophlei]
MLKKSFLVLSLLLPLTALSATAQAGLTISDQRSWPSEARQSVQSRTGHVPGDLNSAYAYDRAVPRSEPTANASDGEAISRYQGGPKSPW